jgi:hypothetical protein
VDELGHLPGRSAEEEAGQAEFYASVISHQHPDHDT